MLGMGDHAGVGSNELVFNVSMVLYGRAVQARNESRGIRIARPHDARQRRADCGILAVVLAHAALESAWHWEMQVAGVQPPPTWPRELENGIRRVADARGRPVPSGISEADKSDFELLCAWRNFLQHADARARQRLAEKLGADFHQHLGADLAEWAIEVLDTYARHFAGSMGGQPLGPSHLVWAGGTNGLYAVPDAPNPEGLTCWDRWIPH
jgi:hypothetical protein